MNITVPTATTVDPDYQAAIIIPHYNDHVRLVRCLDALCAQNLDGIEVVVVDNGSDPGILGWSNFYPAVRFIEESAKGAAHARNAGVAATTAEQIWFLDADCVPSENWVATARQVAGQADIVGGAVGVFCETDGAKSGSAAFETVFAFDTKSYIEKQNFTVTANLLTFRRLFARVGGFRDGVPEDKDWCLRAVGVGADIKYIEALSVDHPVRPDWPALKKKWHRLMDEAWGTWPKGFAGRLKWVARAVAVVLSSFAHAPKVIFAKSLRLPERLKALVTLFRLRSLRAMWMLQQAVAQ